MMSHSIGSLACKAQRILDATRAVDFLAPLALRIYLFFPLWMAGTGKFANWDSTVAWFGNPEWGLGMPLPEVMVALAAGAEAGGAVLLLIGLAVRWASIPLMVTMAVAAITVHWDNGWLAIADTPQAAERLAAADSLLQQHGNYGWLTETGQFVILNNGIEFAATYFIMLLALFFIGGGRWVSVDYYLTKRRC